MLLNACGLLLRLFCGRTRGRAMPNLLPHARAGARRRCNAKPASTIAAGAAAARGQGIFDDAAPPSPAGVPPQRQSAGAQQQVPLKTSVNPADGCIATGLKAAGLTTLMASLEKFGVFPAPGTATLLAPTNQAFESLPNGTLSSPTAMKALLYNHMLQGGSTALEPRRRRLDRARWPAEPPQAPAAATTRNPLPATAGFHNASTLLALPKGNVDSMMLKPVAEAACPGRFTKTFKLSAPPGAGALLLQAAATTSDVVAELTLCGGSVSVLVTRQLLLSCCASAQELLLLGTSFTRPLLFGAPAAFQEALLEAHTAGGTVSRPGPQTSHQLVPGAGAQPPPSLPHAHCPQRPGT
jgi:hypothetical protein